MALVTEVESTLTTVVGTTPQQLLASTTNAARVIRVDLGTLVAGERGLLRVQRRVLTAGTVRDQVYARYLGPVANPIIQLPPVSTDLGLTVTFTQENGSPRAVDYGIYTFGAPLVVETENTLSPTVGTKHPISTTTTNKTRLVVVDFGALATGDAVAVRVESKIRSAGTLRDQHYLVYPFPLAPAILETAPLAVPAGATISLTQTQGTAKPLPYKVYTLD